MISWRRMSEQPCHLFPLKIWVGVAGFPAAFSCGIMYGGRDLSSYSTYDLLELLSEILLVLTHRLHQFGPPPPGPPQAGSSSGRPTSRQTPDTLRAEFECHAECVFCGAGCCRLEPGHTHHKCRDHLRWR